MASSKETSTWQSKRPFEETNVHMLQHEILCDVMFLVGTDKKEEIKAHKFMLASRSPVFYSMFCGSLSERDGTIQIPDIEPWAFRELLRFIYTEVCEVNEETVMALLYSSKKYETKRLTETCMEYLNGQISTDNVCVILQHAHSFDEKELKQKCIKFVLEHGNEVLKSDGFLSISKEILGKIVKSDELNAEELSVYNACKRWALQRCKENSDKRDYTPTEQREQLGDLVYSVRFPTMSFETFATHVSIDQILTQDETIDIFQRIANVSTEQNIFNFSMDKRQGIKRQRLSFHRCDLDQRSAGWGYQGNSDNINFTVSAQIRLVGIGLFSPCVEGTLHGKISLQCGDLTLASKNDVKIEYNKSKLIEEVLFERPVVVEAGKVYSINALLNGTKSYYITTGQEKVSSEYLVVSFYKNDKSTNGTDVFHGQIPSLIFEV